MPWDGQLKIWPYVNCWLAALLHLILPYVMIHMQGYFDPMSIVRILQINGFWSDLTDISYDLLAGSITLLWYCNMYSLPPPSCLLSMLALPSHLFFTITVIRVRLKSRATEWNSDTTQRSYNPASLYQSIQNTWDCALIKKTSHIIQNWHLQPAKWPFT